MISRKLPSDASNVRNKIQQATDPQETPAQDGESAFLNGDDGDGGDGGDVAGDGDGDGADDGGDGPAEGGDEKKKSKLINRVFQKSGPARKKNEGDNPGQTYFQKYSESIKKDGLINNFKQYEDAFTLSGKIMPNNYSKSFNFPVVKDYTPPSEDYFKKQKFPLLIKLFDHVNPIVPDNAIPALIIKNDDRKRAAMQKYYNLLADDRKDQKSENYKLIQSYFGSAKWNKTKKTWQLTNGPLQRKIDNFERTRLQNLDKSASLLNMRLSGQQIQKYVPSFVNQIVSSDKQFGKTGIGPISFNGVPLFAGRYLDKSTGKIRMLPAASNKYINPLSFKAHKTYLQARVINKWNALASAAAELAKFSTQDSQKWTSNQIKSIKNQLKIQQKNEPELVLNFYKKQLQAWALGMPMSPSSHIVLNNLPIDTITKILILIKKPYDTESGVTKQKFIKQKVGTIKGYLQQEYKKVIIKYTNADTPKQIQQRDRITLAFGVWLNKGQVVKRNLFRKIFKTLIPPNLTQVDIQNVQKLEVEYSQRFNKANVKLKQEEMTAMIDKMGTIENMDDLKQSLKNLFVNETFNKAKSAQLDFPKQKQKIIKKVVKIPEKIKRGTAF